MGSLLTLGAPRGPPHVLDDVPGRGASGRPGARPEHELGQPLVPARDQLERADCGGRSTDGVPFGSHLVDEGDALLRCGGGHGATVTVQAPPIPPPAPVSTRRILGVAIVLVGDSVRPMDIDEFYEADPRRRASAELELGIDWLDADGVRHELNYVEDTGELYVLREPSPHVTEDPFGGLHVSAPPGYDNKMTVHIIAHIPTVDERAPDPRRLAGGHAGRPRRRLARRPAACGRCDGRPGGRPHPRRRARCGRTRRSETRWAVPGRASWPGAGWRCCRSPWRRP